jgi:hypothetical protein
MGTNDKMPGDGQHVSRVTELLGPGTGVLTGPFDDGQTAPIWTTGALAKAGTRAFNTHQIGRAIPELNIGCKTYLHSRHG